MAITTTSQLIYDGPYEAKILFTGTSDGSGEVTNAPLVVAEALSPLGPGQNCGRVRVQRVTGNTSRGNVQLLWDAETPLKFADLAGAGIDMDFRSITALRPPATLLSATGSILYSTSGFTAGSSFTLELDVRKTV